MSHVSSHQLCRALHTNYFLSPHHYSLLWIKQLEPKTSRIFQRSSRQVVKQVLDSTGGSCPTRLSPNGGPPDACPVARPSFSDMYWACAAHLHVARRVHTDTHTHPDLLHVSVHTYARGLPIMARLSRALFSEHLRSPPVATSASGVASEPFRRACSLLCPLVPCLALAGSGD